MSLIELWPKQQEVFEFARDREATALLAEQRTGKTFITLKLIEHQLGGGEFVGLLVGILANKESTWLKHTSERLPQLQVFTDWDEFKQARGHRLFLTHFEALPGLIGKLVKYRKFTWACVDESHRLNNPGSKQSRAMARLSWIPRRVILTGTPMEKRPTDFFGQFKFLDPEVLGTNKGDFEEEWLDWKKVDVEGLKPWGPAYREKMMLQRILKGRAKFKWERLEEFLAKVEPYCIRIEKTEVGIKPPQLSVVPVDMPSELRALYNQMEESSWVELPDGTEVLAPMAATYHMKLRQLACGFVYDEEGEARWLSDYRINRALELIEGMSKPVVVFCAFIPELHRLVGALKSSGYDVGELHGGTPKKSRGALLAAFQAAQMDVLVCQLRAGGVGVDLWKSSNGLITSMAHSSIVWDQAKARMDARGKNVAAHIKVLVAKNSIDEELHELLETKGLETQKVLEGLKRRYKWPKRPKRSRSTTSQCSPKSSTARPPKSAPSCAGRTSKSPARPGAGTRSRSTTRR